MAMRVASGDTSLSAMPLAFFSVRIVLDALEKRQRGG